MPIYQHRCANEECGHYSDFVRYSIAQLEENEIMECPECGQKTWKREIGAPAFDCVGQGFYINDYGKKAWRKNMSNAQQMEVLAGNASPY